MSKARQDTSQYIPFSIHTLLNTSGYLCAVHLCGGTKGLGLFPHNADEDYPYFGEFHGDQNVLASALRRRAFRTDGSGRVTPIHRTIAEFLAAKYLVHRVREGLPLKRVLALLTGFDGGTLAELRGVYAWLACLCEEESAILIDRDPLGIILYGDAAILSLSSRQLLIKSLRDISKKNPSFRAENWSAEQFGALVSADLAPTFAQILKDQEESPFFLDCILDAIEHGPPLPDLGHDLLQIVYDHARAGVNRVSALAAFFHILPNDHDSLKALLDDIHEERVLDVSRMLRGTLLYRLYPAIIQPHEIGRYLVQEAEHTINAYTRFVAMDLVLLTNPEELPLILSEVNAVDLAGNPDHYIWREFIGHLILQILVHHGETAPKVQLYDWLGKALDQYWQPVADQEETAAIQKWLSSHPTVIQALFQYWLSITPFESPVLEYNDFWARLYNVNPPEGFPPWLLQLAGTQSNMTRAEFLFRESVRMSVSSQRIDRSTLEELWEFTRHNDRFRGVLENELSWNIPTWRIENAVRKRESQRRREARRAINVQQLSPQLDTIRSGRLSNALLFLAKLYFGLFPDVDCDSPPEERLVDETTEEIATVAWEGFIAALHAPDIPTPRMIGDLEAEGREYSIGFPVLAGMDCLTRRSMSDVLSLPEATLQSALAFHYANTTGVQREWVPEVIASHPATATEALSAYWGKHLELHSTQIPGLYDLNLEMMYPIAPQIALVILQEYPNCSEDHLKLLLLAAVRDPALPEVLALVEDVLKGNATLNEINQTLWYAAGFLLHSDGYKEGLERHICSSEDKAARLLSFICPSIDGTIRYSFSVNELTSLIEITGPIFTVQDVDGDGGLGLSKRGKAAISVQSLILRLGKEFTFEATKALVQLQKNPQLVAWRFTIAYALADQTRQRRELAFKYPSVDQVLETLKEGKPSNATDLQALVSSHLHSLRADLQDGPTDGWKAMWNVDSYAKPTTPRPENDCRDRLLEHLRQRLVPVGVTAEPEGHYAEDKRADIKALTGSMNLPIEIKRHYHPDLWDAPREQLQKLYARDPGTAGRGIYVVLWFGIEKNLVPKTPAGIDPPKTTFELETALTQVLPESDRDLIEIIVINCAKPKQGGKRSKVARRLKKQR